MDLNLIIPGGAIIVDNTLMKVLLLRAHVFSVYFSAATWMSSAEKHLPVRNTGNIGLYLSSARLAACMQGRTYYSGGVKDELADAIREFNEVVRKDPRVDVVALPFRDGVSIITRRCALQ